MRNNFISFSHDCVLNSSTKEAILASSLFESTSERRGRLGNVCILPCYLSSSTIHEEIDDFSGKSEEQITTNDLRKYIQWVTRISIENDDRTSNYQKRIRIAKQWILELEEQSAEQHTKKDAEDSVFVPIRKTFMLKRIANNQIQYLYQYLRESNWIDQNTDLQDFVDLFSGFDSDCKITWLKSIGALEYLFKVMIKTSFVQVPEGYAKYKIVSSHFCDEHEVFLQNINKGKVGKKDKACIDNLMKFLTCTLSVD